LAADDHDQDSEDTKEEGETGDEEQEAEEKDGEVKGQAAPPTTAESDGDDARSLSPPPVDRTHHSPRGKRRMSDKDEREELMRVRTPPREDVPQLEQYGSGGEGGNKEERVHVPLRMDRINYFGMTDEEFQQYMGRERAPTVAPAAP
jgi:hypothetical protein